MTWMTDASSDVIDQSYPDDVARLSAYVIRALSSPVVALCNVSLWAGFLHIVQYIPRMQAIHAVIYRLFRARLEALLMAALRTKALLQTPKTARRLAICVNAVLDSLWLAGSALPDAFDEKELPSIKLQTVGAIIGLDLMIKED